MGDREKSHEEWMAEERARLDKGFSFEPEPTSAPDGPGAGGQVLAGLGLGAGVVGGVLAPHPNPVTFEGCKAEVIISALRKEIADDDTRVQVDMTGGSVAATILQSEKGGARKFAPAVNVTLIEKTDALTVTVGALNQDSLRGTISSMGDTLLDQGKKVLSRTRRSGAGGLLDAAGQVMDGVEGLIEDVQDLGLPRRVWGVIDRVGAAAEQAYLDERRQAEELQRKRALAVRAWTHCEWCGRAYAQDEETRTDCPTCGGPRGDKPAFLE